MEERLRLRYIEDTNTITQFWSCVPNYIIVVVYNTYGDLVDLICEEIKIDETKHI